MGLVEKPPRLWCKQTKQLTPFIMVGRIITLENRQWTIEGQFLGAEGQESVYELLAVGLERPTAYGKTDRKMFVPTKILEALFPDIKPS